MDKDDQYLLFALSTPMEIRNPHCLPSHASAKMYLGIKNFNLSSSWGINNRDQLIATVRRMTNHGHASDLAGLYHRWFRFSPREWREYVADMSERRRAYAQFVAETACCCGEGGIKSWDYVRMGFLCRMGVLNQWLTEEESLWLQSRVYVRAHGAYQSWRQYFAAYTMGRLYWQSPNEDNMPLLREVLARKEYDESGYLMFNELLVKDGGFYNTLPWRPLA